MLCADCVCVCVQMPIHTFSLTVPGYFSKPHGPLPCCPPCLSSLSLHFMTVDMRVTNGIRRALPGRDDSFTAGAPELHAPLDVHGSVPLLVSPRGPSPECIWLRAALPFSPEHVLKPAQPK